MYSLNKVGEHTYYIDSPANVGLYEYGGKVCMIDSGSDKDAAKKALKHIEAQGWTLDKVICTHSHADHAGGAALLKQRTGCTVYAVGMGAAIIENPILEPVFLFGGYPLKDMRSKFTMSPPCECEKLTESALPEGLTFTHIDGHDFEQVAVCTSDGVWFIADSVVSTETLSKYKIAFLYDIEKHLETLKKLETLEGRLFIPAHCEPMESVAELARANAANIMEVAEVIKKFCADGLTVDDLLEKLFAEFGIRLYLTQYALIGHTTRSYLSWLCSKGEIEPVFEGTRLLWKTVG